MKRYFFILLFFYLILQANLFAQKLGVNVRIDSTVLRIGDQTNLVFEITQNKNLKVITPIFSDTIVKGLELVAPLKSDTIHTSEGSITVKQSYLVTSFTDSLLYIPAFPFVVDGDTTWSKSLSLKVVQPFKVDTASNSVADIKPVLDPKFNWMTLLKWILLINIILAIVAVLFFFIRKYWFKKPIFVSQPAIKLPPSQIAYEALDHLRIEKPWHHGRIKEYHTQLTDILRLYIEEVFEVQTMEMTSDEILAELGELKISDKPTFLALKKILELADLVKFAKWTPTPDENESSLTNSYLFVNNTKLKEADSNQIETKN